MYVIAGATGRVGGAAARRLLEDGAEVRVLVRDPRAAERWGALGADARVLDLRDRATLTEACRGAAGLFVLLPFDLTAEDLDSHAAALTTSIAGAVDDAGVSRVVMLSSGGADLASGTGPVAGLYRLEEALRTTTTLTALRPGHFQEKVTDLLGPVMAEGVYPVLAGTADRPLPMGATADVGRVAAEALRAPAGTGEVIDVLGPERTEREVAGLLGELLGRELHVAVVPAEAWEATLTATGLPGHAASSLAELYRADEAGMLAPRGDRTVRVTTPLEVTLARVLAEAGIAVRGAGRDEKMGSVTSGWIGGVLS